MARNFLSINSNFNDFASLPSPEINKFLLENNELSLKKVYGFAQKAESILFITGFLGTGKTQIAKHLLNYIDKDVYSFKVDCSAATTLDDILLFLWAQFITVASNSEIAYKYQQVNSFQDKITGCFADSFSNIMITFFNFDLISDDNLQAILDFIWSISNNDKIKIVITAKTFDTTIIPNNIIYTKVILKALSRIIFEKYLQDKGLKATPRIVDELYKITRGYYFYTEISANILLKKALSINDYLVAYTNSGMSFDKFLAKAFISMLPKDVFDLLAILAVTRHPANSQLLDYLEAYDKHAIDYLKSNKFIKCQDNLFVINNYFVGSLLDEMSDEFKQKLHKLLLKFYNAQLPFKPSERLILISRTTMRKEIDYHTNVISPIPENQDIKENPSQKNIVKEFDNLPTSEILKEAEKFNQNYNYNEALRLYLLALNKGIESDVFEIYKKLANIYDKLGNLKYSLHYFNQIIKHFREVNDITSINRTKLSIARIYYQSYKTNEAINILYEIISESTDSKITIDAYTLLGNIYISLAAKNKAYELYNKAITLSERESVIDNNLSELYFKFAILADENEETDNAIRYYKRCIEVADDNNKYKSLSYSNLGDFFLDADDNVSALENFKKAYHYDELNANDYGMYYSASNVAKLIVHENTDEAFDYMLKAKTAAIKANDLFAMANAGLHLGDYYSNNKKLKEALNEYLSVLNLVKDKFRAENKNKITVRIEDIKQKIGEDKFNELLNN